jgi:8-oxo-dGTP pyrophosphatase MutT (NUDIX family)
LHLKIEFRRFLKDISVYLKIKKSVILLHLMKAFENLISKLEEKLRLPLPGLEEQLRLAPITRLNELKEMKIPGNARKSAVLALFYPQNGQAVVLLIKRAVDDTVHSGQISFPGGKKEEADADLKQTALRETYEEVGIAPENVTIIGTLSKMYIPPSNFEVQPFVGYVNNDPQLTTNCEVESVLKVPVSELTGTDSIQYKTVKGRDGEWYEVPCYFVQDEIIWGATAMMLSELTAIISE